MYAIFLLYLLQLLYLFLMQNAILEHTLPNDMKSPCNKIENHLKTYSHLLLSYSLHTYYDYIEYS